MVDSRPNPYWDRKPKPMKLDVTFKVTLPCGDMSQYFGLKQTELGYRLYVRTGKGYRAVPEADFDSEQRAKNWTANRIMCDGAFDL